MSRKKRTAGKKASSGRGTAAGRTPGRFFPAVLALLFFFAFSVFGLRYAEKFFGGLSGPPETERAAVSTEKKRPSPPDEFVSEKSVLSGSGADGAVERRSGYKPRVVLIIDDLGNDRESLDRLAEIGVPLNVGVLPYLPYSGYVAREAEKSGMDVILHLPMEPRYSSGYTADDAGEGVLLVGYSLSRIKDQFRRNFLEVPNAIGVNNHMGSKFMENEELVRTLMEEIKTRGLYFVDSLTSSESKGYGVAKDFGVKALKRDVFIDSSDRGKEYTKKQIDRLVGIAEKTGMGVGIGHPYPQTIEALAEYLPGIAGKGKVEFVKISSTAVN